MSFQFFEWLKWHKRFLKLWDHQFVLWGLDIKCKAGDRLKEYGLLRFSPERPLTNSSAYYFENQDVEYWFWAYGVGIYSKKESKSYFFSRDRLKIFVTERVTITDPFVLLRRPELSKKIVQASDWKLAKILFSNFLIWCGRYENDLRKMAKYTHRQFPKQSLKQEDLPLCLGDFWLRENAKINVVFRSRSRFGLDFSGLQILNQIQEHGS
jgi:hypothetical protein